MRADPQALAAIRRFRELAREGAVTIPTNRTLFPHTAANLRHSDFAPRGATEVR